MSIRHVASLMLEADKIRNKIPSIKCVRDVTSLGLKDSKHVVERGVFVLTNMDPAGIPALLYVLFRDYKGMDVSFLLSDGVRLIVSMDDMKVWQNPMTYLAEQGGFVWVEKESVEVEGDKALVDSLLNVINEMNKRLN